MPLPPELSAEADETTVIGDMEAFVEYIESGQALHDWHERRAALAKEMEELL